MLNEKPKPFKIVCKQCGGKGFRVVIKTTTCVIVDERGEFEETVDNEDAEYATPAHIFRCEDCDSVATVEEE